MFLAAGEFVYSRIEVAAPAFPMLVLGFSPVNPPQVCPFAQALLNVVAGTSADAQIGARGN